MIKTTPPKCYCPQDQRHCETAVFTKTGKRDLIRKDLREAKTFQVAPQRVSQKNEYLDFFILPLVCLFVFGQGFPTGQNLKKYKPEIRESTVVAYQISFSRGTSGKEIACQCRRLKRCGFHLWVRKIPWRRAWQSTPVFLPGESHGQRSLASCSPWGHKESDTTEVTQHGIQINS